MKTGPLIGCLGWIVFWLSVLIHDKQYEGTQLVLGLTAMCTLAVATIVTGVQKGRPWLGVGLSLLSWLFGVGFIVMLFVSKKEKHQPT